MRCARSGVRSLFRLRALLVSAFGRSCCVRVVGARGRFHNLLSGVRTAAAGTITYVVIRGPNKMRAKCEQYRTEHVRNLSPTDYDHIISSVGSPLHARDRSSHHMYLCSFYADALDPHFRPLNSVVFHSGGRENGWVDGRVDLRTDGRATN